MAEVTVVGAGVIGLTTAVVLEKAGHDVTVVASQKGIATTSGAAGAVWLPFRVGPPSRALGWARHTREELAQIAERAPGAGVDMVDAFLIAQSQDPPWWAAAVDGLALETSAPGFPSSAAWKMRVPRCDPRLYLPWLEATLRRPVAVASVDDLARLDGEVVVNCSGLGAKKLTGDPELGASLGQTVVVSSPALDPALMLSDDRAAGAMFYVIPRRGEFVLGGCCILFEGDEAPMSQRRMGSGVGSVCANRSPSRPTRSAPRARRTPRPQLRSRRRGLHALVGLRGRSGAPHWRLSGYLRMGERTDAVMLGGV